MATNAAGTDLVSGVTFVSLILLVITAATFAGNQDVMDELEIVVIMSINCAVTTWSASTTGKPVPIPVKTHNTKAVNLVTVVIALSGVDMAWCVQLAPVMRNTAAEDHAPSLAMKVSSVDLVLPVILV